MVPGSPVKISVLWGDYNKGPFGMLLKQPGGLEGPMHTHASDYLQIIMSVWTINETISAINRKPRHTSQEITREEANQIISTILRRTIEYLRTLLLPLIFIYLMISEID